LFLKLRSWILEKSSRDLRSSKVVSKSFIVIQSFIHSCSSRLPYLSALSEVIRPWGAEEGLKEGMTFWQMKVM
jgi:hypothetical protein